MVNAGYSSATLLNDVALLYFATSFTFTSAVSALALPPQGTDFPGGTRCIISGWGTTSEVRVVSIVFVSCDCESIEMWLPTTKTNTNLFAADGNFSPVLLYAAMSVVAPTIVAKAH